MDGWIDWSVQAAQEFRTSTQTWLRSDSDRRVRRIDRRVANLTGVPARHQEDVQVGGDTVKPQEAPSGPYPIGPQKVWTTSASLG